MREIKFRAWDRNRHEFFYLLIQHPSTGMQATLGSISDLEPWQQYTGLKDKNGVEIYEGDVVRTDWGGGFTGEVKYWSAEFGLERRPIFEPLTPFVRNEWKLEVIGNIYENPELLEAVK